MSHEQSLLVLALELKMKATKQRGQAIELLKEATDNEYEAWQLEEAANNKTYFADAPVKVYQ